ncbi:hypothetical protein AKJ16_DCAP23825 [Drosera capensis]
MSEPPRPLHRTAAAPLLKQRTWSPDTYREEAWLRRKENYRQSQRRTKSVTDEDLDELKACFELGFGFEDSPDPDKRLSDTFPALGLYYAVKKKYTEVVVGSEESEEGSVASPVQSPLTPMFSPGDDPERMKTRLRQWAQVVACSLRQQQ